jgi:UDP-glucose 4-epimerase
MNKIVITGAKGYIGSALVEKLKESNYETIELDIEDWDIRTKSKTQMSGVSCVVHLAALVKVGESVKNPWNYYKTNVLGTKNVIDAFPGAKFIFASTGAAFIPESPYGISKVAAESLVKNKCREYTIFRFYNVGGRTPTNPEGLYAATQKAKGKTFKVFGSDYNTKDGTCVRDYVHVEDVCDAIVRAIEEPGAMTDYEPLGSGKSYTVKEYIETYTEVNGNLFKIEYGERRPGDLEVSEVPFVSKFMKTTKTLKDIVKENEEIMDRSEIEWPEEKRIDIIGQNGNDGDHYDKL